MCTVIFIASSFMEWLVNNCFLILVLGHYWYVYLYIYIYIFKFHEDRCYFYLRKHKFPFTFPSQDISKTNTLLFCLSQVLPTSYVMILYVQYIDIDGIVYHHCSSFLFIAQVDFNIRKNTFFWPHLIKIHQTCFANIFN